MAAIGRHGELIECTDEAIREYILNLSAQNNETQKFVLVDLPPVHLFVKKGSSADIKKAINKLINNVTFKEENR